MTLLIIMAEALFARVSHEAGWHASNNHFFIYVQLYLQQSGGLKNDCQLIWNGSCNLVLRKLFFIAGLIVVTFLSIGSFGESAHLLLGKPMRFDLVFGWPC